MFLPGSDIYTVAVSFSTFYNQGNTEQGLFETRLKYFTPLIKAGESKIRTFVNLYYIRGFNRYSDEYLYLRNNDLIRGFRNDSIPATTGLLPPSSPSFSLPSHVLDSGSPFSPLLMPDFLSGEQ